MWSFFRCNRKNLRGSFLMPNFKIIQDVADQARVKVFGAQDVALATDAGGNLAITPPANGLTVTAPASGLSITPPTGGLSVTAPANGLTVTAPASGLSITPPTGGLSITAPANGLTVTAPASGLSITPPTNGILVTSTGLAVVSALATTDVSEIRANITDTDGTPDTTFNVLAIKDWSFGLVNNSLDANAQATAQLQLSPDDTTWFNNGAVVTLNQNTASALVPSIFLKYARVYYAAVNAASAVTLNIFFQGQS
jgi:hypothetical protein